MAYTQDQLIALESALAKGERRVSFGDKTVEYRSVQELRLAMRDVRQGLLKQVATPGQRSSVPRQIRINTLKAT